MSLTTLLSDLLWDAPFFKLLAQNDTGAAKGHQGGMVIPKDLRRFFPGLTGATSIAIPTLDHRIEAQLFVDEKFVGTANTRYQFQTWGGARSPESRLTDQLGPLRNMATGGDYLVIQRSLDNLELYRLLLVTKGTSAHAEIAATTGGKGWGLLTSVKPLDTDELHQAEIDERAVELDPFLLFDDDALTKESRTVKVARSIVFRATVLRIYESKCCVCGECLTSPKGQTELQAGHIVPRSLKGFDDARNGLCLCGRHHWAFDNGLFGIDGDRRIFVARSVLDIKLNGPLAPYNGKHITEANEPALMAAKEALAWHLANVVHK